MAHPLQLFIEETGDTVAAFARRVGASTENIDDILSDREALDPMLARRIAEATGGALSFEQLMNGRGSVVADLSGRTTLETSLDLNRLSKAIGDVVRPFAGRVHVPTLDFDIAAEAVAHTYAALARVTTVRGEARLAQALRPVIQEILRDHGVLAPDHQSLEAAALAATRRYYRT